jgi:putative DNA primase/helicase
MKHHGPPLRGGPGQENEDEQLGTRSQYPAPAAAATPKPNVVLFDEKRAAEQAVQSAPDYSEDETALAFADRHHRLLRFDHSTGEWYVFHGNRWRQDPTQIVLNYARTFGRLLAEERHVPNRTRVRSLKFARNVEHLARTDRRMAVRNNIWDTELELLGTPNAVINLATGEELEPDPDFYITRATSVDPGIATDCINWLRLLNDITGQDEAFKRFLQQWAAYCLSGRTDLQKLLFIHGPGGTGKSTFVNMLLKVLADYATSADMSTFTDGGFEKHSQEFARLAGRRLVIASETEEGRHWRENRIKQLTGGDTVTARHLYQDDFEYRPQFKLTFFGNHAPMLRNVETANQRRMIIAPFLNVPIEQDHRLEEKLTLEMPGILRWALNGYSDLCAHGLLIPKVIKEATTTYFDDQNVFGQWLAECCDFELCNWALSESTSKLFQSWNGFAQSQGTEPGNQRTFNDRLRRLGLEPLQLKHLGTKGCRGIRVKQAAHWQDGS